MMPWTILTLMMRTPEYDYLWTAMGYTFGLGAFELDPRTGAGTQAFVSLRLTSA